MDNHTARYISDQTRAMIAAPSCCREARSAGAAWLKSVGTAREAAVTQQYLEELEADIMPIDGLISFAASNGALRLLGADGAAKLEQHAKARKAAGEAYCDCPACAAAAAILEKKTDMLR